MLLLIIYVLSVFEGLSTFLGWWIILTGIATVILFVFTIFTSFNFEYVEENGIREEKSGKVVKWIKKQGEYFDPTTFSKLFSSLLNQFKYWIIIPLFLYALAPSERTQYIMLGTYVGQASLEKIENSDLMKKVGTLIELKLDSILSEEQKDSNQNSSKKEDKQEEKK